jgi:transcription elongation GreA/GreB family factor
MNLVTIKHSLYQHCQTTLKGQINALEENLQSIVESRDNETKSSVGDKYETGRAMMQLEFQKVQSQLNRIRAEFSELKALDINKKTSKVEKGSIVLTNQGIYFVSVSLGKIKLDDQIYFCLSSDSPIGRLLLHKRIGDKIQFNKKEIDLLQIA